MVVQNGWHYALGKPLSGAMAGLDGVVGFGGRQGANWMRFRLARLGYLHWPTRGWNDIGGAPTYTRTGGRLTQTTSAMTLGPLGEQLPLESVATWGSLWTTPGAGNVSARWRVHGGQLKEEVTINQAAREWIATNRPPSFYGIPASESYFGLVFRLDWSDVPRVYRAGVLQDRAGDFSDDGGALELRDDLNRLLAYMPLDDVYVPRVSRNDPDARLPLRKRAWRDADGNDYLLVGVLASDIASLRAGALVFDPTVNEQVGASADDADEQGTAVDLTRTNIRAGKFGGSSYYGGARFTTVNVDQGATITSATFTVRGQDPYTTASACKSLVYMENADNPGTFTSAGGNISGRSRTSQSTAWNHQSIALDTDYSITVTSQCQAVVNRAGFAANNAMAVLWVDDASASNEWQQLFSYDNTTSKAPKLDIVTSAAAAAHPKQTVVLQAVRRAATH